MAPAVKGVPMTHEQPRGPRERMVFSAAQLIRRQGVTATGVRDVVEHAHAPRGSLQHYFPDGKDQLVNEAVDWAGRYAGARVERFLAGMSHPTPSKLFAAMTRQWIEEYRRDGFAAGCPLAAATVDRAATSAVTRPHLAAAVEAWRRPVAAALTGMGVPPRRSGAVATLMISTLEGAIVLARAEQDLHPLFTAMRELGPHLDTYVIDPA
jgi:AcrR family transcriptional regulator